MLRLAASAERYSEHHLTEAMRVAAQTEVSFSPKYWNSKPFPAREYVEQHFQDHAAADTFQRSVARLWRFEHALRNGQKHFRQAATEAQHWLAVWIQSDPQLKPLAEKLLNIIERTVRTSSAAENINSVLRPYLDRRRECTDLVSRQLFLNLFVLWFNLHKFERGPRKCKSPYEIAGINLGTDDWLTLLGYPPD